MKIIAFITDHAVVTAVLVGDSDSGYVVRSML